MGGGYCMITTPNTDSLSAKIMGKRWLHYNSEHLNYFNIKSMQKLSELTGFKIIKYGTLLKTMRLNFIGRFLFNFRKGLICFLWISR